MKEYNARQKTIFKYERHVSSLDSVCFEYFWLQIIGIQVAKIIYDRGSNVLLKPFECRVLLLPFMFHTCDDKM